MGGTSLDVELAPICELPKNSVSSFLRDMLEGTPDCRTSVWGREGAAEFNTCYCQSNLPFILKLFSIVSFSAKKTLLPAAWNFCFFIGDTTAHTRLQSQGNHHPDTPIPKPHPPGEPTDHDGKEEGGQEATETDSHFYTRALASWLRSSVPTVTIMPH